MAEAILSRLLEQQVFAPGAIMVGEPRSARREYLLKTYQVNVTPDNQQAANASDVVLLAVKPQILDRVLASLAGGANRPLVISILAGVPIHRIQQGFPNHAIIRAMPNTPATVGAGVTAIASNKIVEPEQLVLAKSIFSAVGNVVEVPENLIDAVTGVSGSGPAYVAMMIEALADGGVLVGLPRSIATQLALQTVLGTAQLVKESHLHPAELKDQVTSPGGTTIAGVAVLEKMGFRSALIEAVRAAFRRSQDLGRHK
jgi:pyrroline-5-carboxylate reductase